MTFDRGNAAALVFVLTLSATTAQPNNYISEAISVIAAGLFYDPRPKTEVGLSVRYAF